jgi:hypothetical protein
MKKLVLLVTVMLACGVGSALAQDIRYNYDTSKDFSLFKTYKWVPINGTDHVDELTARQLTAAIDAELAKKGMEKTDSDTADLYIGYQTAIGSEKQFTAYQSGWGYGPGRYGYYGGMGSSTTYGSTSTIYIGQLDLSMYDPKDKQLVWRGSATKTLDPKANAEKKAKNITKAMAKLLKSFPPKAKG